MKSVLAKFLSKPIAQKLPVKSHVTPKPASQQESHLAELAKQAYEKLINLIAPSGNSMSVWQGHDGGKELFRDTQDSIQVQQESKRAIHVGNVISAKKGDRDSTSPSNISYAIVPKEKSEIVAAFLIQNYHEQEPITMALGMPVHEVDGWFQRYIRHCMFISACDVSVQAVDEKAQRRVGVLASVLVNPLTTQRPIVNSWTNRKMQPINAQMNEFYDKLEAGLDPTKALDLGDTSQTPPKYIEHLYLSVHPDYGQQGISNEMVRLSESVASNIINCRIGYTITSSAYSYSAFLKNGYKTIREIKYSDYTDSSGKKIFAGLEGKMQPHTTCSVMVKQFNCLHPT